MMMVLLMIDHCHSGYIHKAISLSCAYTGTNSNYKFSSANWMARVLISMNRTPFDSTFECRNVFTNTVCISHLLSVPDVRYQPIAIMAADTNKIGKETHYNWLRMHWYVLHWTSKLATFYWMQISPNSTRDYGQEVVTYETCYGY